MWPVVVQVQTSTKARRNAVTERPNLLGRVGQCVCSNMLMLKSTPRSIHHGCWQFVLKSTCTCTTTAVILIIGLPVGWRGTHRWCDLSSQVAVTVLFTACGAAVQNGCGGGQDNFVHMTTTGEYMLFCKANAGSQVFLGAD